MAMRNLILLTTLLVTTACNSYKAKTQPGSDDGNVIPASIDYAFVNSKVFAPKCIRCHSEAGGNKHDVNLESYENVLANLDDIADVALNEKSMPPKRAGGPLSDYEQTILKLWIEEGAPRDGMSGPAPTPTPGQPKPGPTPELPPPPGPSLSPSPSVSPAPEPPVGNPPPEIPPQVPVVLPTWDSISANIFQQKCVKCHAPGEKAKDYPLQDKAFVTDENNDLLVPGKPDESNLYKAITRAPGEKKLMPPAKTGMTLSDQEKEAIRIWILNGAKD